MALSLLATAICAAIVSIVMPAVSATDELTISIPLASHGLALPRLGLGTAALHGSSTYDLVTAALEAGVQLIDSAQAPEWYNEEQAGKAVMDYRAKHEDEQVIFLTKIHPRDYEEHRMQYSLDRSSEYVHGDNDKPIDVVLLHSSRCWTGMCTKEQERVTWKTAWRNLEEAMAAGQALAIGVSNFHMHDLEQLLDMADAKVSVVQNWMDPFNQDTAVREFCKRHGIVYMAYSSFGTQWQHKLKGRNPVFESAELQAIADKHSTTIAQVVLSWVMQEGAVAIPRSNHVDRVKENAALIKVKLGDDAQKQELTAPEISFRGELAEEKQKYIHVFLDDDDMESIRALDGAIGDIHY